MFHVEDDFDFEDDLLDVTSSSSDISSKLAGEGSKNLQKTESTLLRAQTIVDQQYLDNEVEHSVTDKSAEFLKLWEAQNGNDNPIKLNISFPNESELSTRYVRKTVRQRKFPGPAGLLPERQGNTSLIATEEFLDELNSENNESLDFKEKEILSQRSESVFESGAWGALLEDLGISGRSLISVMNLASLRFKHTRGYKVPFLAVIINNIDCTLPDPTVIVKDPTDEMHGMLHREVWEKFNTEMLPGSVLVLKNVGVISAGTTSRRHVLNITANNLTAIYSNRQEEEDVQVRRISELPTGDNSKILAEEWEKLVSSPLPSKNISRNTPSFSGSIGKFNRNVFNLFNSPTASTPQLPSKTSYNHRQLMKGQSGSNSKIKNSISEQPLKKHKNMSLKEMYSSKGAKQQSSLIPAKSNTFKIDSDTSLVDTLLDGVDTDSLFEEF